MRSTAMASKPGSMMLLGGMGHGHDFLAWGRYDDVHHRLVAAPILYLETTPLSHGMMGVVLAPAG